MKFAMKNHKLKMSDLRDLICLQGAGVWRAHDGHNCIKSSDGKINISTLRGMLPSQKDHIVFPMTLSVLHQTSVQIQTSGQICLLIKTAKQNGQQAQ
jgi:hypothetical protein